MKTFELDGDQYIVLETAEEADQYVSDEDIESALEWFIERRGVPMEDFLDKICGHPYLGKPGIEIERFDDPAAKRLLSRARKMKKEMDDYAS